MCAARRAYIEAMRLIDEQEDARTGAFQVGDARVRPIDKATHPQKLQDRLVKYAGADRQPSNKRVVLVEKGEETLGLWPVNVRQTYGVGTRVSCIEAIKMPKGLTPVENSVQEHWVLVPHKMQRLSQKSRKPSGVRE